MRQRRGCLGVATQHLRTLIVHDVEGVRRAAVTHDRLVVHGDRALEHVTLEVFVAARLRYTNVPGAIDDVDVATCERAQKGCLQPAPIPLVHGDKLRVGCSPVEQSPGAAVPREGASDERAVEAPDGKVYSVLRIDLDGEGDPVVVRPFLAAEKLYIVPLSKILHRALVTEVPVSVGIDPDPVTTLIPQDAHRELEPPRV